MKMTSQDLNIIRKRNKALMPSYMQEYSSELSNIKTPSITTLAKADYLAAWINIFDPDTSDLNDLLQFDISELEAAFTWTLKHFAELDLGGNYKWLHSVQVILKLIRNKEWVEKEKNKLICEFIIDTRWYDY